MASFQVRISIVSLLTISLLAKLSVQHTVRSDRVVHDPKLSDQSHYQGGSHNLEYDHEAFLGTEEAKDYLKLTPEQSKERLGKLVDRIDKDKDEFVSEPELQDFIDHQQRKSMHEGASLKWKLQNEDKDSILTWQEYNSTTYSGMSLEELTYLYPNLNFGERVAKDKARWAAADQNNDQMLDINEYTAFLNPHDYHHMRDVVIDEIMSEVDTDGDGRVMLSEYIADVAKSYAGDTSNWREQEREQFESYRDKNRDGYMSREEVGEWIMPLSYDPIHAEARHLILEADINKDNKLTKEEIVNKYEVFVGSQATAYGEALSKHDEF